MPQPKYLLEAPCCGAQLTPHAGTPDSTPWVCHGCHRGFWVAELRAGARARYEAKTHTWGAGPETNKLREDVDEERARAHARGTSALPEHLGLLEKAHIRMLKKLQLPDDFRALMKGL